MQGKVVSYSSVLPVAKAQLSSGVHWLSAYLMNSERHPTSISPSPQQSLSSYESSCAIPGKDS